MALITCPECNKKFSEFADRCPNCGCPSSLAKKTNKELELISKNRLQPEIQIAKAEKYSDETEIDPSLTEKIVESKDAIEKRKNHRPVIIIIIIAVIFISIGLLAFCQYRFGILDYFIRMKQKYTIEEVKESVVKVYTYSDGEELATGSGFCAYENDYIITNYHVICGGDEFKIETNSEEYIDVKDIVCFNIAQDIAILQIDGNLEPLKIDEKYTYDSNEEVTAIGSPIGLLNTVSTGIISKKNSEGYIQTTAAISSGSSGGVLLDQNNIVIGITSAGILEGENLGFAIPIVELEKIYDKYGDEDYYYIKSSTGMWDSFYDLDTTNMTFMPEKFEGHSLYVPSSIKVFADCTDVYRAYGNMISQATCDNYYSYAKMSSSDKELVVELALFLEDEDDTIGTVFTVNDIYNFETYDFAMALNIVNPAEYAIARVAFDGLNREEQFDVSEKWNMLAAQKSLLLYLEGAYYWEDIHTSNKNDIFEYLDQDNALNTLDKLEAALVYLGYEVDNDGENLTAYW